MLTQYTWYMDMEMVISNNCSCAIMHFYSCLILIINNLLLFLIEKQQETSPGSETKTACTYSALY